MIQKYNGHVRQQIRELLKKCSLDDITEIAEDMKLRRTYLHSSTARSFVKGDKVEFTGRRGEQMQGVVEKVAKKYVTVDCTMYGGSVWRVPGAHLKEVA